MIFNETRMALLRDKAILEVTTNHNFTFLITSVRFCSLKANFLAISDKWLRTDELLTRNWPP